MHMSNLTFYITFLKKKPDSSSVKLVSALALLLGNLWLLSEKGTCIVQWYDLQYNAIIQISIFCSSIIILLKLLLYD